MMGLPSRNASRAGLAVSDLKCAMVAHYRSFTFMPQALQQDTRHQPLVSVIMIFFDSERFIREAIESVFAQSYNNWELLLVDDGSADASTTIAREYATLHPGRVRCLEHPGHHNRGMSASRNLGIRNARGELIAFLDSDDVWLAQKLEFQARLLAAHPAAAMIYGATEHWFSWTGRAEDTHRDIHRALGVPPNTLVPPPSLIPLFLTGVAQTPGTCGILIRREVVERAGAFDEQFRGMYEDQVFLFKVCLREYVFVESGSWDRYRQHPQSHSAAAQHAGAYHSTRPSSATRVFLDWFDVYLAERCHGNAELRGIVARARRPYRYPVVYAWLVAKHWIGIRRRIVSKAISRMCMRSA